MKKNISIGLIGVGGGGCNSLKYVYDRLYALKFLNIKYAAINTDVQALNQLGKRDIEKVIIGIEFLEGMGAGAEPYLGYKSMKNDVYKIVNFLKGKDIIFLSVGLGGGTGSGATPVLVEECKKRGILVIVFGTFPWAFEGKDRRINSLFSLNSFYREADSTILINNDFLSENEDNAEESENMFLKTDKFLEYTIMTISIMIIENSTINIDFNDIKKFLGSTNFGFFFITQTSVISNNPEVKMTTSIIIDKMWNDFKSRLPSKLNLTKSNSLVINFSAQKGVINNKLITSFLNKITSETGGEINILFGLTNNPHLNDGVIKISGIFTNVDYTFLSSSKNLKEENPTLQKKHKRELAILKQQKQKDNDSIVQKQNKIKKEKNALLQKQGLIVNKRRAEQEKIFKIKKDKKSLRQKEKQKLRDAAIAKTLIKRKEQEQLQDKQKVINSGIQQKQQEQKNDNFVKGVIRKETSREQKLKAKYKRENIKEEDYPI